MSDNKLSEIFNRIQGEIFLAHEAYGIWKAIAEGADSLDKSEFRQMFGIIQRQSLGAFILSLCNLFEAPNGKYPNYSIHTALLIIHDILKDGNVHIGDMRKLDEFIRTNIVSTFDIREDPTKIVTIPCIIYNYFKKECPSPKKGKELDTILDALKVIRDKRVAHHEDHDLKGLAKTNFEGAIKMLCFAKTFENIIRYGLFGSSRKSTAKPEEFVPEKSESYRQMKTMIQKLNL